MNESDSSRARQIAQAARTLEQQMTGRLPGSVTVVLSEDTVVITLRGTLSPAERSMAENRDGAAQLRELHRFLFFSSSGPLRQEIKQITGVEVLEAIAELETLTGTVVQVFSLTHAVPADTWSGSDPGSTPKERETGQWVDDGGGISE